MNPSGFDKRALEDLVDCTPSARNQDISLTPEEVAGIKKTLSSPGPWYFGDQIHSMLQALDKEWERTGGFDASYMHAFLARLDEEDPPHYVIHSGKPS